MRLLLLIALVLAHAGPLRAELALEDCRISAGPGSPSMAARCGDFERPLDPDNPAAGSITLKVAVVPALSLEPAADAFVPIAGGPGASSIRFYAGWAGAFERVRQSRDILLVDQRGTGESAPMACEVEDELAESDFTVEATLRTVRECLDTLPHDPRFFTTSVAVRDLEAVRAALGYDALNVYGSSYGTRVAQHYARRYPATTRTIIIDGVVAPQVPLGPEIATESQRALDRVLDRCSQDPACSERFPGLRQDFEQLQAALAEGPVPVTVPNPVTGAPESLDFGTQHMAVAIRLLLYDARSIALIPLSITEAANGNYVPLAAQFMLTAASLNEALNIGMHNAVMCTEDIPFIDFAAVDQAAIAASYLGPLQLEAIRTMCSSWPQGPMDEDLLTPLATDIPVLLLSGDADPVTPPRYAELAAVDLERAWLLTGTNQGHGLGIVGCMPRVIGGFVDAATLEDGAADCLGDAFAMPFFLEFTGPKP
ncbi:MAG TPA: alpha/beta fold hydrolase [Woeseiaceae bacterium]|nr:alpha/beta fold hydrolase [Woeseiaceae bacterium]